MFDLSLMAENAHSMFVGNSIMPSLMHCDSEGPSAAWNDIVRVSQPNSFKTRHGFDAQIPVKLDETFYVTWTVLNSKCLSWVTDFMRDVAAQLVQMVDPTLLSKVYHAEPQVVSGFSTELATCLTAAQKHFDNAEAPLAKRYLVVGPSGERVLTHSPTDPIAMGFQGISVTWADQLAEGLNLAWHRDALVLVTRPQTDPDLAPGTLIHSVQRDGICSQTTMLCGEKKTEFSTRLLIGVGLLDKSMMAILPGVEPLDWIGLPED